MTPLPPHFEKVTIAPHLDGFICSANLSGSFNQPHLNETQGFSGRFSYILQPWLVQITHGVPGFILMPFICVMSQPSQHAVHEEHCLLVIF